MAYSIIYFHTFLSAGLLLVLSCCSGLDVTFSQNEYEVARGGNIAMTCSYRPAKPDSKPFLVKWEAQPDKENDPWVRFFLLTLNAL